MEFIKDILLQLSQVYAPCGRESISSHLMVDFFKRYTADVKIDALGNVLATIPSKRLGAKKILIDAHFDEISLLVSDIDENGFVRFTNPFGVDERTLLASEVIVHGVEKVFGIVSCKPPHLMEKDEDKTFQKADSLVIDIGFNEEKAKKLIRIGDSITFKALTRELKNGIISGKALDNRAGVTAIISLLERLKKENLNVELVVLASVQEEAGTRGARTASYSVNPDMAIVIDVTHGHSPDAQKDETFALGSGVMIGISPILKKELSQRFIDLAIENNIPYDVEVMAGNTGTNAAAIQIARSGIPTALMSIPLRYMHTPVEAVMLKDIESTASLLAEFLRSVKWGEKL